MPHKPYDPATSGPQVHDRRAQNTGKDAGGKRVTRRLLLAAGFAVARLTIAVSAEPLTISGPARVIDGNTVAIGDVYVRLKGVDAAVLGTARGEHARRVMLEIVTSELTCRLTGAVGTAGSAGGANPFLLLREAVIWPSTPPSPPTTASASPRPGS